MNEGNADSLETSLLLEAIYRKYGYDFRQYARASIERRVQLATAKAGYTCVAELIPRVLQDPHFFAEVAEHFSVPSTEMFRDPFVYRAVREEVIPRLRTYPYFKVWHAGCSTGEEAYSLAILLHEEELYERATIYATDFSNSALKQAQAGIYPIKRLQQFTRNYQEAGGRRSFSEYYHARYDRGAITSALKARITFANHNLATDTVFGEMHVIFCRNVLIYFNQQLQSRAIELFADSLVHGGFLCLGTAETLRPTDMCDDFEPLDHAAKIYRRVVRPTRPNIEKHQR